MKSVTLFAASALFAAPLVVSHANAQSASLSARTARDLAEICGANPRAPTGPAQLNFCDGFAQGAVDVELSHAGATKPFCLPPGTKREVTMHEFSNWVRSSPARGSDSAATGLFRFLAARFPCK